MHAALTCMHALLSQWMAESGGTVVGEIAHLNSRKFAMMKEMVRSLRTTLTLNRDPKP